MRCGTGAFQIRSCPRNCKRQARANPKPLGSPGKAVAGGEPSGVRTAKPKSPHKASSKTENHLREIEPAS